MNNPFSFRLRCAVIHLALFIAYIATFSFLVCCQHKQVTSDLVDEGSDFWKSVSVDFTDIKQINQPVLLSDFAESISYIPLSDDVLLNDITRTSIKMTDDYFFIDGENIFKYTKDGAFVKKLFSVGAGPKEAKKLAPAAFNYKEGYCTFPNGYGTTFKSFSFDGDYLKEESRMDSLPKHICTYFFDCVIFSYANRPFKKGEKANVLGAYLFYAKDTHTDQITYRYPNPAADEDAVYQGGYLEIGGYVPLPGNKLLYTINQKIGLLDSEGNVSGYTEQLVVNDLDDKLSRINLAPILDENTYCIFKGHLYFLIDAYRFFEEGSTPPSPSMTEESNPVIIKLKLK